MLDRADRVSSILLCADRSNEAQVALRKASILARYLGASIELFACDADHAWALARAPEDAAARAEIAACLAENRRYLAALRGSIAASDLKLSTRAACAASFAEGVAERVREGGHALVMKHFGDGLEPGRGSKTAEDMVLAKACPVPLLLTRSRPWRPEPCIWAASGPKRGDDTARRSVLAMAKGLADLCHASFTVVESVSREALPDLLVIGQGDPSLTESLLGAGGCDVLVVPTGGETLRDRSAAAIGAGRAPLGDDPAHREHRERAEHGQHRDHQRGEPPTDTPSLVEPPSDADRRADEQHGFGDAHGRQDSRPVGPMHPAAGPTASRRRLRRRT